MYLCTDCAKELHDNMNPDIKIPFPINDILTNMELSEDTINEWINEFKDMEDKGQIEELVQHENPETLQHNNQHEEKNTIIIDTYIISAKWFHTNRRT